MKRFFQLLLLGFIGLFGLSQITQAKGLLGRTKQGSVTAYVATEQVSVNGVATVTTALSRVTNTLKPTSDSVSKDLSEGFTSFSLWVPSSYAGLDSATILKQAKNYAQLVNAPIVALLEKKMLANGSRSAVFNYDQVLPASTSGSFSCSAAGSAHLIWSVTLDQLGQSIFSDPQIVSGNPCYVHVVYTPQAVMSGLPASWSYPNAGTLQYEVISIGNGQTLQSMKTINVAGAYDAPQSTLNSGVAADPDAGLKCLIMKTSAVCNQNYIDVATLLSQMGANYAKVDYIRTLTPVMNTVNGVSTPQSSESFNQRIVHIVSCGAATYENIGSYGFLLNQQTDHYLAPNTGGYQLIGSDSIKSLSPTQSFDLTVQLTNSNFSNVGNLIIDPAGVLGLVSVSSIPNIAYLAPISQDGNVSTQLAQWSNYINRGDQTAQVRFTAQCNFNTGGLQLQTEQWDNDGYGLRVVAFPNPNTWYPALVSGDEFAPGYYQNGVMYQAMYDGVNTLNILQNPRVSFPGGAGTAYQLGEDDQLLILSSSYVTKCTQYSNSFWGLPICAQQTTYLDNIHFSGFNLVTGQPLTSETLTPCISIWAVGLICR